MKYEEWKRLVEKERIENEIEEVKKLWKNRFTIYGDFGNRRSYFMHDNGLPASVDPINYEGLGR